MNWYLSVLKNYAVFEGRAHRTEYWMFVLFNFLISLALAIVDAAIFGQGGGLLSPLYALGVFIPSLAVGVRRLHDTNRSGWWLLIALVPLVGFIVLLVFTVSEGDKGPNDYGADPWA